MARCGNCGYELIYNEPFCPHCGQNVKSGKQPAGQYPGEDSGRPVSNAGQPGYRRPESRGVPVDNGWVNRGTPEGPPLPPHNQYRGIPDQGPDGGPGRRPPADQAAHRIPGSMPDKNQGLYHRNESGDRSPYSNDGIQGGYGNPERRPLQSPGYRLDDVQGTRPFDDQMGYGNRPGVRGGPGSAPPAKEGWRALIATRPALVIVSALLLFASIGALIALYMYWGRQSPDQIRMAEKYMLDGNYANAIDSYKKVLESDPNSMEAHLGLADAYIRSGDFSGASDEIESIRKLGFSKAGAEGINKLVDAYIKKDRPDEGIRLLQSAYASTKDSKLKERLTDLENSPDIYVLADKATLVAGDTTTIRLVYKGGQKKESGLQPDEWRDMGNGGSLKELSDGSIEYTTSGKGSVKVRASIGDMDWDLSIPVGELTVSGVQATPQGTDSIKITWELNSQATGYKVLRASSASGQFKEVGETLENQLVDTELEPDTEYWYEVRPLTADGEGSSSGKVSARTAKKEDKTGIEKDEAAAIINDYLDNPEHISGPGVGSSPYAEDSGPITRNGRKYYEYWTYTDAEDHTTRGSGYLVDAENGDIYSINWPDDTIGKKLN